MHERHRVSGNLHVLTKVLLLKCSKKHSTATSKTETGLEKNSYFEICHMQFDYHKDDIKDDETKMCHWLKSMSSCLIF